MRRVARFFALAILLSSFCFANVSAKEDPASIADSMMVAKAHESKKFQPGEFMLDHIIDSHEWHIITIGHTHVSIPLPVIVYSKVSGLHIFMSSKFHHGTESYKNFHLATDGPNKGKIVESTEQGEIVPLDLSITKVVFSLFLSVVLILFIFISIARKYTRNPGKAPSGFQGAVEPMILFVRDDIAKPSLGEAKCDKFLPYLLTLFFFIWINNMMGLIPIFPGGANVTGNIAITMVLAAFTFVITTVNANKHYWKEIYNAPGVPWWLKFPIPLIPLIEFMGMIIKPVVLTVRLFANITAGHLIILAFVSLIFIFGEINPFLGLGVSVFSTAFAVFMLLLEFLVALIQAYVFTLLSAIYFSMAIAEHHEAEAHH